MTSQSTRYDLPGFSLPLNFTLDTRSSNRLFPNALDYHDVSGDMVGRFNTNRDLLMMQVINSTTEKRCWDRKVFDEAITSKWRQELTDSGKDISPQMIEWIIKELQWKADTLQKTGQTVAFDPGVVKSDTQVPDELKQALKDAVRPLEEIPDNQKDYHPGSDNKVVDLVHPSLFPVIYGRTHILPDQIIGLDDCLHSVRQGKILEVPPAELAVIPDFGFRYRDSAMRLKPYSCKFQWLPCDIEPTEDGNGCHIASYINNLHPQEHRPLYEVIESVLARTLPLWDTALTNVQTKYSRIEYNEVEFLEHPEPEPKAADEEEEASVEFCDLQDAWEARCPIKQPEPSEFQPPMPRQRVDLRQKLRESGLQVIVKLANIELSPEKPEYEGGSWHVEGQLNEHICATALYYYDSSNITENTLSFRQRAATDLEIDYYPQGRHEFLPEVFGFTDSSGETNVTQDLGSVSTHEGRLLTFPNTMQHRVSPFSLTDKTKPGHRKIIAFFLVDPNLRIISSANVPPQREDWWVERNQVLEKVMGKLPPELQDMVVQDIDTAAITMDEAKQYRLELMEERKTKTVEQNQEFEIGDFSLCEH